MFKKLEGSMYLEVQDGTAIPSTYISMSEFGSLYRRNVLGACFGVHTSRVEKNNNIHPKNNTRTS